MATTSVVASAPAPPLSRARLVGIGVVALSVMAPVTLPVPMLRSLVG
jgi:hypothetical protein